MANTKATTLSNLITEINDRSAEWGLATHTTAETVRYMNRAVEDLRRKHDFAETRTSATVSFTPSSTLPYASVALSSFTSTAVGFWSPSYLNNANEDYEFWWCEPDALRALTRGDYHTYEDVEQAFAIDGTNMLIYHNVAETLTLKYYSRYLVATATTGVPKETFASNGTDADWFIPENEELLILGTLLKYVGKEEKPGKYEELKVLFNECLFEEKRNNPSQRPRKLEELQLIG